MKRKVLALCMAIVMLIAVVSPLIAKADNITVERVAGKNRYDTAVKISQRMYDKSDNVVIASGENFADALAGGQLANHLQGPILLTSSKILDAGSKAEIGRLKAKKAYILGGYNAISQNVENQVKALCEVERISGENRIETSLKIVEKARALGMRDEATIFTDAYNFPDALAAGTFVAMYNYSLVLSEKENLPNLTTKKQLVLGGQSSLPLPNYKGERISGKNRYETALKLAKIIDESDDNRYHSIVLVDGTNYPDALASICFVLNYYSPILLTNPKALEQDVKEYISKEIIDVLVVGGKNSVSEEVVNEIKSLNQPKPVPNPNTNETDVSHFEFELDNNELSVKKYLPSGPKDVVIPEIIEFKGRQEKVQHISDHAFEKMGIKSIELPGTIKTIGNYAFNENEIGVLNLPIKLEYLGECAFWNNKLTKLVIPGSLKNIPHRCFADNQLQELLINDGVEEIGPSAFGKNQISVLNLPDTVKEVGERAFDYNKITSIKFSNQMTEIKDNCFQYNELQILEIPRDVKTIGKLAFADNAIEVLDLKNVEVIKEHAFGKNNIPHLVIPDSVVEIGARAFDYNRIEKVFLSRSLEVINEGTFNTNQLDAVLIPDSVKLIEKDAFTNNRKGMNVYLNSGCTLHQDAFDPDIVYNWTDI